MTDDNADDTASETDERQAALEEFDTEAPAPAVTAKLEALEQRVAELEAGQEAVAETLSETMDHVEQLLDHQGAERESDATEEESSSDPTDESTTRDGPTHTTTRGFD